MADIATFITGTPVEEMAVLCRTFKATAAITAGQVVCFNATGVSDYVEASVAGAGSQPIGVALTSQATVGGAVNVCMMGVCSVTNADDTTGIDAGDMLVCNDNAVKGTVVASLAVGSQATPQQVIGIALQDIAGGSYGMALICPFSLTAHA
jgi:hypothetical protein